MGTATAKRQRQRLEVPPGQIVNLHGMDRIQGYGDSMQIRGMRGDIALDAERQSVLQAGGAQVGAARPDKLLTGAGSGVSQVLIQPLHLQVALLNGLPSPTEEMGVVLDGRRYFFNAAMRRGEGGQWAPQRGAPPKNQWYVIDDQGNAQHPDIVKQVFDLLLKAVELYYRARYRDFVLAELAWYNNSIMDYEEAGALATKLKQSGKKPTREQEEQVKEFYAARFSGKVGTMREAEARVLAWLEQHPES